MRFAEQLKVPVMLERTSSIPLHVQITKQIVQAIVDGILPSGSRIPSTRTLSDTLGVSRSVTVSAFTQLLSMGYLESRPGSGTYVTGTVPTSRVAPASAPFAVRSSRAHLRLDLRAGQPSVEHFPLTAWRSAWRSAGHAPLSTTVAPPQGIQELRVGIARYLRQYRSVFCTPGQIIVTSGTRHALDLVARTVFPADRPVAVDEPGCPVTRIALQHRGLRLTGVPSDQDGLLVDALPADAGAVVTSAARHRPHGNVLSLQRRHALLTWAKRTDAVVVETDPGLEFAVGVAPLPSLLALAGEQPCVHIGSFSDVFTPTLRIGYLLGQTHLLAAAAESIAVLGEQPDLMTQRATAQLLGNNELASHVARMTRLYEAKRRLIRELVAPVSGLVTGLRLSRGFDAVIELAARVPAADVSDALAEQGIILPTVENYYLTSAGQECNALILGFGYLSRSQLLSGLTAVVSAIKKASCRGRMMVRAEVVVLRAMNSTSRS